MSIYTIYIHIYIYIRMYTYPDALRASPPPSLFKKFGMFFSGGAAESGALLGHVVTCEGVVPCVHGSDLGVRSPPMDTW